MLNASFLGDMQRLPRVGLGWVGWGWVGWGWGKVGNKAKLSPASAGTWAELGNKSRRFVTIIVTWFSYDVVTTHLF